MRAVRVIIILFAILAIATGGMDVLVGTAGQANIGLDRSVIEHFDPVLDSQVRYLGAIWLGLGVIQLIGLGDPRRYRAVLECTFAAVILGGIGRVLSWLHFGMPQNDVGSIFVKAAMGIELALIPLVWIAFRISMRQNTSEAG